MTTLSRPTLVTVGGHVGGKKDTFAFTTTHHLANPHNGACTVTAWVTPCHSAPFLGARAKDWRRGDFFPDTTPNNPPTRQMQASMGSIDVGGSPPPSPIGGEGDFVLEMPDFTPQEHSVGSEFVTWARGSEPPLGCVTAVVV